MRQTGLCPECGNEVQADFDLDGLAACPRCGALIAEDDLRPLTEALFRPPPDA